MEQTLGKRIAAERKRLCLTQDQLAERLGVTAQAVSKWENDQSCPDITMLPKLAEIFGTTTDALLGMEPKPEVHKGEVVARSEIEENENNGFHFQNGDFEFKYDTGRRGSLATAVLVLLVGGLLLLGRILQWDISFWGILWPSALLVYGFSGLLGKFTFLRLGCVLFGGYFLLDTLNVLPFALDGSIVWPVILILFGLSLLVDALRKPKKPLVSFQVNHKGGKEAHYQKVEGETFEYSASFCEDQQRVDMSRLSYGSAAVSFGEMEVDLSGVEEVSEDCTVKLACSFGELRLLVPRRYRVQSTGGKFLASVDVSGQPDPNPVGTINVETGVAFGEIGICYI